MKVTAVSSAGSSTDIEIDVEDSLEELQVLIEVALSVPIAQQALSIDINGTVAAVPPTIAPTTQIKAVAAQLFPGGLNGPVIIRVADKSQPAAAAAAVDDEVLRLFAAGRQQQQQQAHAVPTRRARNGSAASAGAAATGMLDDEAFDPLNPEVQRRMMEEFRLRAVDENLRHALEHTPEAFGSIWMLYVPTTVNGVKINAFVDSGAQMTIMSEFMAEKCNLTRLIDRRHQGVAKGVGESKITGVVHLATVQMGGVVLPMRITILESRGMDFLIGLDQLRRHQMCIDMRSCVLRLDDTTAIPFLSEPEIEEMKKKHELEEAESERLREQNRVEEEKVRAAHPQRSPQLAAASASSGAPNEATPALPAAAPAALTDDQKEKISTLVSAFGVPPGVARSALEAAQWDADNAVTFLGL